ncbi:MAG: hypothetical protein NTV94_06865 [Planctomycetota bacterium]|nr:hypothetical protein [Planctomycetota bacterium]
MTDQSSFSFAATGCFTSVYNIAQVVQLGNYLLPDSGGIDLTPEGDAGLVGELRAGVYNGSGQTTIEDLMQFMDDYAAGAAAADVTGDAEVGMEDASTYVDYYMGSIP